MTISEDTVVLLSRNLFWLRVEVTEVPVAVEGDKAYAVINGRTFATRLNGVAA